jgi:hypothetical protein
MKKIKQSDIPHFDEWEIVEEKFAGTWSVGGHSSPSHVIPLMEITRAQRINGLLHVVTVMTWGSPIHFKNSEENMMLYMRNKFAFDTLFESQKVVKEVLQQVEPVGKPKVNIIDLDKKQRKQFA